MCVGDKISPLLHGGVEIRTNYLVIFLLTSALSFSIIYLLSVKHLFIMSITYYLSIVYYPSITYHLSTILSIHLSIHPSISLSKGPLNVYNFLLTNFSPGFYPK